jgi:hypothetical protein
MTVNVASGISAVPAPADLPLLFSDTLTPVIAEGVGHGIAQAIDAPSARTFLVTGSPNTEIGQLGGDIMATYIPGPFQKIGVAVYNAFPGLRG